MSIKLTSKSGGLAGSLSINATEVLTITEDGNVGIGTTNPETILHLVNPSSYSYMVLDGSSGCDITLRKNGVNQAYIGSWVDNTLFVGAGYSSGVGNIVFETSNGSERMRITADGNVGIGTNPFEKLSVYGTTSIIGQGAAGNAGIFMQYFSNPSNVSGITSIEPGIAFRPLQLNASEHRFLISDTERMRINSDGDVVIGNPTSARLELYKYTDDTGSEIDFYNSSGNIGWVWGETGGLGIGGTTGKELFLWANAGQRAKIDTGANFSRVIPGGSTLYPDFCARAWVNFNGTDTVAIRGSGNVSSITDNGVGDYTVNFTTAMPDTNFSTFGTCGAATDGGTGTNADNFVCFISSTVSSSRIQTTDSNTAAAEDTFHIFVCIFR